MTERQDIASACLVRTVSCALLCSGLVLAGASRDVQDAWSAWRGPQQRPHHGSPPWRSPLTVHILISNGRGGCRHCRVGIVLRLGLARLLPGRDFPRPVRSGSGRDRMHARRLLEHWIGWHARRVEHPWALLLLRFRDWHIRHWSGGQTAARRAGVTWWISSWPLSDFDRSRQSSWRPWNVPPLPDPPRSPCAYRRCAWAHPFCRR